MKRYLVIIAAIVMQACLGTIYAWSAFVPALRESFGYSSAQMQLVFGTSFLIYACSMIVTGRLQDRHGPRPLAAASGLFVTAAYFLAWAGGNHFVWLWLGIGVLGGLGIGCGYVCPLATAVKWFPNHKGLVCGLAVAGYGGGAIVLANLAQWLMNNGWQALDIFKLVGIIYGPMIILAGMFLFTPREQARQDVYRFSRTALFRDYRFWQLSVAMFCGTLPGLMINGNLKPIGLSFGLSSSTATMAISFFAVGSATGRILWGFVNDRLGRVRSTVLALSLIAVSALAVLAGESRELGFLIISLFVGLCYGSSFALYPAQVAEIYGAEVMGTVYALVIFSHGLAAVVGPGIGGLLFDLTNSFFPALIFAGAVAAVGVVGYSYLGATIRSR